MRDNWFSQMQAVLPDIFALTLSDAFPSLKDYLRAAPLEGLEIERENLPYGLESSYQQRFQINE